MGLGFGVPAVWLDLKKTVAFLIRGQREWSIECCKRDLRAVEVRKHVFGAFGD